MPDVQEGFRLAAPGQRSVNLGDGVPRAIHIRQDGRTRVTWWDPHALGLEVEPAPGIRREALIVKDVPESVLVEGRQEYEKWRTRLETTIASGSTPSVSVLTATEWASTASSHESVSLIGQSPQPLEGQRRGPAEGSLRLTPVDQPGLFDDPRPEAAETVPPATAIEIVDAHRGDRPGGARFGELVHAVLASTSLDADRIARPGAGRGPGPYSFGAGRRGGRCDGSRDACVVARAARARPCRGRPRDVPTGDAAARFPSRTAGWSKALSIWHSRKTARGPSSTTRPTASSPPRAKIATAVRLRSMHRPSRRPPGNRLPACWFECRD